jgi:N-acetylglucosaminyl-diphospho-decaprenol L-rhamnosyltransferase
VTAGAPALASPSARGICVSVVSHGQGALVDRVLADLAALPDSGVQQVVVTVNVPGDPWQPAGNTARWPITLLRNAAPLGFGENHNRAFAHCTQPLFAVLNPDIRLPHDPFPPLVAALQEAPSCALAVPVQLDAEGRRESFARPVPTPWGVLARRLFPAAQRARGAVAGAQWVAGAFMLWRAEVYAQLGGFDTGYFLYCEDVDICLRLQLAQRRFEVVEAVPVVHAAQRGSGRSWRYLAWHARSLLRLWTSPVFWQYLTKAGAAPATR